MTEVDEKAKTSIDEIWNNLVVTDQTENRFQFSVCRNRHIVVIGTQKSKNYIIGDIIRRDTYIHPYYQPRKDEQKTITYVMVPDHSHCNVCIINLIDIPPIEYFLKHSEKSAHDHLISPMSGIDRKIYKYATYIDLIVLVCEANNYNLINSMKKWASDRGHIMALALIVDPKQSIEQREKLIFFMRNNEQFKNNNLDELFQKGIFCVSDLSYSHFRNMDEQNLAQTYVKEWRTKFLRTCIGNDSNEDKFEIPFHDPKQQRNRSFCFPL